LFLGSIICSLSRKKQNIRLIPERKIGVSHRSFLYSTFTTPHKTIWHKIFWFWNQKLVLIVRPVIIEINHISLGWIIKGKHEKERKCVLSKVARLLWKKLKTIWFMWYFSYISKRVMRQIHERCFKNIREWREEPSETHILYDIVGSY